jgi:DNA-binding Lrp family transcriptional regulator
MASQFDGRGDTMTTDLTATEKVLLDLLAANARESVASLARKLGISRTTVQERVRRLEEKGAISGYTIIRGEHAREPQVTAHTLLRLHPKRTESVITALKTQPEVKGVYALSGDYDVLVMLRADRMEQIDAAIDLLGGVEGVERTQTSIVLAVKFERRA